MDKIYIVETYVRMDGCEPDCTQSYFKGKEDGKAFFEKEKNYLRSSSKVEVLKEDSVNFFAFYDQYDNYHRISFKEAPIF